MQLTTIQDAEENAWLSARMHELALPGDILVGGSDGATEGTWVWPDGVEFWRNDKPIVGVFANWDWDEPNNAGEDPGEDCVTIQPTDGRWNDRSCSGTLAFICEER
jgi:hypothetical protein